MNDPGPPKPELLSAPQRNHFLVTLKYADQLLSEVEQILRPTGSEPLFPRYASDLSPEEVESIETGIAGFRKQMIEVLQGLGIPLPSNQIGAMHAITTNLDYIEMELENLNARGMRAYGELSPAAAQQLEGTLADLKAVLHRLLEYVRQRGRST